MAQRVGRGIALLFHDRSIRRGEWSAARPALTLPRERTSTHFTGGWVGPRAALKGRKFSSPPGFRSRTVQPVVSRYTDWATGPTLIIIIIIIITTLQYIQGNRCKIGQKALVWTCAKISRNKSRRQGNHIVESTSTNWQNYSQNKPDIIIHDNEKGTCMLTEIAISGDRNMM